MLSKKIKSLNSLFTLRLLYFELKYNLKDIFLGEKVNLFKKAPVAE